MSSPSERAPRGLIVVLLALQLWLGLMAAGIYLSAHNSLYNNGNWTATKTTLSGNIMGAFNYLFNLQTLASGRLGLSAWHGYQEVVLKEEVDPAVIEFDYLLKNGGHLVFEFNRTDRRFVGIRLTDSELFPPVLVRGTVEGRFLNKKPFEELPLKAAPAWQRLRVEFQGANRIAVWFNKHHVKTLKMRVERPQRIGFRGSLRPGWVDNVRIESRDGSVFFDNFSRPANWRRVKAIAVGGWLALSISLYLVLRRLLPIGEKYLLFYCLMVTLVLLVVGGLWQGVSWHQKKFYPNATEKMRRFEEAHIETGAERMIERIESRHSKEPPPGVVRLLFLGSSQTRGSGTAKPEHTLVRWTERLLNQRAGEKRFECLNAAVRGYRLSKMVSDFEALWVDWTPDIAILNAGNNDAGLDSDRYERSLARAAETARRANVRLVLVLEPNSVEHRYRGLRRVHGVTREFGRRHGLPVVEMHERLGRRVDEGFLWWDWVHLTSFGQRVFAEELVTALVRQGVVSIAGGGKRPEPKAVGPPQRVEAD